MNKILQMGQTGWNSWCVVLNESTEPPMKSIIPKLILSLGRISHASPFKSDCLKGTICKTCNL